MHVEQAKIQERSFVNAHTMSHQSCDGKQLGTEQRCKVLEPAGAKAVLDRRKGDDQFQAAAGAAFAAAAGAYSPYRQTPAGVALASGQGIHSGGIVENAAFNPTLQPLQAAFAAARCAGMKDYSEVGAPTARRSRESQRAFWCLEADLGLIRRVAWFAARLKVLTQQ